MAPGFVSVAEPPVDLRSPKLFEAFAEALWVTGLKILTVTEESHFLKPENGKYAQQIVKQQLIFLLDYYQVKRKNIFQGMLIFYTERKTGERNFHSPGNIYSIVFEAASFTKVAVQNGILNIITKKNIT